MKTIRLSAAFYIAVAVILPVLKMTTHWPKSWWVATIPIYGPPSILAVVAVGTALFLLWEHLRQDWTQ